MLFLTKEVDAGKFALANEPKLFVTLLGRTSIYLTLLAGRLSLDFV
jgi:hypothetical protein